jgi:hypothetical protein
MYRDLNPQNVLKTFVKGRWRCVLSDLGVAERHMPGEKLNDTQVCDVFFRKLSYFIY